MSSTATDSPLIGPRASSPTSAPPRSFEVDQALCASNEDHHFHLLSDGLVAPMYGSSNATAAGARAMTACFSRNVMSTIRMHGSGPRYRRYQALTLAPTATTHTLHLPFLQKSSCLRMILPKPRSIATFTFPTPSECGTTPCTAVASNYSYST
jgi:hypothetical protein